MNMDNMSGMEMSSTMAAMASAMSSMSMDMARMSMSMAASATGMDMSGMAMPSATDMAATAASAMAGMDMSPTSTAASGHGMGGMGMSSGCKISMLWNWNTIDACFISSDWKITTSGRFAGTCIGVFFWVVAIILVQRVHREFDRYIYRQWAEKNGIQGCEGAVIASGDHSSAESPIKSKFAALSFRTNASPARFRPNLWQQLIRACLFTLDFGAGYLLMLMAMYYNGYILITMWLGALIGYFFLASDTAGGFAGTPQRATCC